jgi:large conductance mechanosensitive channel
MIKEFREFIAKGNIIDIAIGLLIATAFAGVVTALTKDLINPIVGLVANQDFTNWFLVLKEGHDKAGNVIPGPYAKLADADAANAIVLKYGDFITVVVNFLINAFVIFLIVKAYNKLMKREKANPPADPVPTKDQVLLEEIRDLLKAGAPNSGIS